MGCHQDLLNMKKHYLPQLYILVIPLLLLLSRLNN